MCVDCQLQLQTSRTPANC